MEIKKTLDNMPRLVFWRIDDATIVLVPFCLGVLFGSLFLIILGFIIASIYRRLRKQNRHMNFRAALYWGLGSGFSKIPSYVRKFRR